LLAVLAGARPHRSTAARWAGVAMVIALAVAVAGARTTGAADEPGVPVSTHTDPGSATTAPPGTRAATVPPAAAAGRSTAESPHTRDQAAPQTSPVEPPEALAALLEAVNDRDAQVREKAALVIGLWPDERASAALIHALADPDAQVREKAAIGLALRRRPGAVEALLAAIRDPDAQVREKAAIALGMSGDQRAAAALAAAMNDPDPQVREKVASALLLLQSGRSGIAEEAVLPAAIRLGLRALVNLVR
jgi:HEAT repeats